MECRDARPYLPLYPDRDEPPEVLDALRVHLERCASCAAELKRLQAAWDALNAWDGMEPPAGLAARVRERAQGAQRPARRIRWISLATAAAAPHASPTIACRCPAASAVKPRALLISMSHVIPP